MITECSLCDSSRTGLCSPAIVSDMGGKEPESEHGEGSEDPPLGSL